jgi:hypothetical protein
MRLELSCGWHKFKPMKPLANGRCFADSLENGHVLFVHAFVECYVYAVFVA